MPKIIVPFGGKTVVLNFGEFNDEIDVDQLTSIDYSNLFGEIVTVSALLNRIGILKAEAEAQLSMRRLECDIYEAGLTRKYRREANTMSGKFTIFDENQTEIMIKSTEDSILMALSLDPVVQNKRKSIIEHQKNLGFLDSLYWSIQSKDKKLSVLMKDVTPAEFVDSIIEGEINGILIKKMKDTWTDHN